jgi:hypothetical protein
LIPKIKTLVEEGAAYEIENVLVAHNDPKYKTTEHRFKINLMDRTKFTKLTDSGIPKTHFDFVSFRTIAEADREDKCVGNIHWIIFGLLKCFFIYSLCDLFSLSLADVIGHVVERDALKVKDVNGKKSNLLDLTLEDHE